MFKVWCDFIEKDFIQNEFKDLIAKQIIYGATSNPSILANAFKTDSYKQEINKLKHLKPKQIYEKLALNDIYEASRALYPLYKKNISDGYISIEIDPNICDDINESIKEGKRIFEELNCENVMIKVPATNSGFTIIEELSAMNIPVNATLIFSEQQMLGCLKAFKKAKSSAQAVISVFVSRFDRELDDKLNIKGKYGIFNATNIYKSFLHNNDKNNFRILFASTGVKEINNIYKDKCYYIYPLAYENTINTMPLDTIRALDSNKITPINSADCFMSNELLSHINIAEVNEKLLKDGLKIFKDSFNQMLELLN